MDEVNVPTVTPWGSKVYNNVDLTILDNVTPMGKRVQNNVLRQISGVVRDPIRLWKWTNESRKHGITLRLPGKPPMKHYGGISFIGEEWVRNPELLEKQDALLDEYWTIALRECITILVISKLDSWMPDEKEKVKFMSFIVSLLDEQSSETDSTYFAMDLVFNTCDWYFRAYNLEMKLLDEEEEELQRQKIPFYVAKVEELLNELKTL